VESAGKEVPRGEGLQAAKGRQAAAQAAAPAIAASRQNDKNSEGHGCNADLNPFALTRRQPFRRNVPKCFQQHMAAHMKEETGKTLQAAARATGMAKSSILQFRWLDAPRSGTARTGHAPGLESPRATGTKADALEHGGMEGNEVLLQRAILSEQKASLLEANLKDMTAQRDKWVLQADYWKEQAQHTLPSPARHRSWR